MLVKEKINQVDNFTYLGNIISKDDAYSEDVNSRIAHIQVFVCN